MNSYRLGTPTFWGWILIFILAIGARLPIATAQDSESAWDLRDQDPLGEGFLRFSEGEYEKAAEVWLKILPEVLESHSQGIGLLYFLDQASNRAWMDPLLLESYTALLNSSSNLPGSSRQALWERIHRLALRDGKWEQAEKASKAVGLIDQWQWVAGPFARFGSEDLEEPFGPELNLNTEVWTQKNLRVQKNLLKDRQNLGILDFEDFIYPSTGVAYAFTRFKVESNQSAIVRVESADNLKVWLNGYELLYKNTPDLDLAYRKSVSCELRQGENWILVKSQKRGSDWKLQLGLLSEEMKPLAIRPISAITQSSPAQMDRVTLRQSCVSGKTNPEQPDHSILSALLDYGRQAREGNWMGAEERMNELIAKVPSFALAHRLLGEAYLKQQAIRSASKNRLEKQAQEHFEIALERNPIDPVAAELAAQYHLSRQTLDEARKLLNACIEKRQAEGFEVPADLWAQRGQVNRRKEFWVEAREDFSRAVQQYPAKRRAISPLTTMLNESQGEEEAFDLYKQALQDRCKEELLEQFLDQGWKVGRQDEGLSYLDHFLSGFPTSRTLLLQRCRFEKRRGNFEEAIAGYKRLASQCPDDPTPYLEQAEISLLQIDEQAGPEKNRDQKKQAVLLLQQALDRSPHLYRQQEQLRQLKIQLEDVPENENAPDWYSGLDLQLKDRDREALERLPQKRAGAVFLIDSSVMELLPNGTARNMVHIAVLLKNKEGRERFAEINIPSRPDVRLLWARTYSPDETLVFEPSSIQNLGGTKGISMIRLEDGSIIDYAYEEILNQGQLPGRVFQDQLFYLGGHEDPMLVSRFVLKVPSNISFHYTTHPADFAPLIQEEGSSKIYIWERREVEGIKKEQFQPSLSELVHSVRISTTPDFLEEQRSMRSILRGRLEKPEEIAKVAREVVSGLPEDRDARIDAIYSYVQEKIEQSNLGGQTVYDTLYTGSGRSWDRTLLAQALLGDLGISSEIAVTYLPRQFQGLSPIPVKNYFAGSLLYIPAEDPSGCGFTGHLKDRWIDFSNRYQPAGKINSSQSQEYAWILRSGREFFTSVDFDQNPGGWVATEVEFNLQPEGSAEAKGLLTFFGSLPAAFRSQMTNPNYRQQIIDYSIGRNLRGIQIEEAVVSGEKELDNHLAFSFKGVMPQLLRPAGERYHLAPILEPANLSDLVPDATRETPLDFQTWAKILPYSVSVQLPAESDWTFLEVPEDTLVISEFGMYSLIFSIQGATLNITRSLLIPPGRIDPEDYSRFAEFCRQVDAAEKRDVMIGDRKLL